MVDTINVITKAEYDSMLGWSAGYTKVAAWSEYVGPVVGARASYIAGQKGLLNQSDNKQIITEENTKKYYRIQTKGDHGSFERITVNSDGTITLNTPDSYLNISGDAEHALYFYNKKTQTIKGQGSYLIEIEVPKWFDDFLREEAISQINYKTNPRNQGGLAPKQVDITTPGTSYELSPIWSEWLQENATNARIIDRIKLEK